MTGSEGDGFTITGEKNIRRVGWLQTAHATAIEINTGLKMRPGWSAVRACNRISGGTGRTKKKALQDLLTFMYEDHGFRPTVNSGVHRASGWMRISLHVVNAYQVGGRQSLERVRFVREFTDEVIPPPPPGEEAQRRWAQVWIAGFMGEGSGEWDNVTSWHDAKVTDCSVPGLIGVKFDAGY